MWETLELPLWLVLIAGLLAALSLLNHFLIPSARWFLRRRLNRVIDDMNERLALRLPSFKLTRREVLIDRLTYDPVVMAAVEEAAEQRGEPRDAVMVEVSRYAREIVPAFNAFLYFRVGYWLARRVARFLYRVRVGYVDDRGLADMGPTDSVVFVMNHRSNMDYVLAAYLAADRTTLSYAVGEWARVWPLQQLIRALGAYFVRRESGDTLYRRVLARYVEMATEGGVPQAVYPEGGLSRDGRLRPPKLGILGYITRAFDPAGPRDIVFVPVGINYDRVLEDRSLLLSLDPDRSRRGAGFALRTAFGFVGRNLLLMARGRWHRFGYACVNFGAPVSYRDWLRRTGVDPAASSQEEWFEAVRRLGEDLMAAIGAVVPVLPVSLVAAVLAADPDRRFSELELKGAVLALIERLEAAGARLYVPRTDRDYAVTVGLRMLAMRHAVTEEDGLYRVSARNLPLLRYYANAIAHLLPEADRRAAAE
ncbi:MAG: 1-acyl-sn-glycerol-3-phosphate acyltransferase [Minwuiales bacterium]|nr:1-acyl-sn-glycerol-3-phosphate acyltransferase [Minwuiales bacterium]